MEIVAYYECPECAAQAYAYYSEDKMKAICSCGAWMWLVIDKVYVVYYEGSKYDNC